MLYIWVVHHFDVVVIADHQNQPHVSLQHVLNGSDGFLPAGFDQDSQEVAGQEMQEKSSTDTPQQKTNV